jgi:hypothetical protein
VDAAFTSIAPSDSIGQPTSIASSLATEGRQRDDHNKKLTAHHPVIRVLEANDLQGVAAGDSSIEGHDSTDRTSTRRRLSTEDPLTERVAPAS